MIIGVISDTHGLLRPGGSAGPRRFKLPIAVGRLHVSKGKIRGEIIPIG